MSLVLVIEDDSDTRDVYLSFLQWSGFDVASAASGAEGRAMASRVPPAAILLDVTLPDMDGCALRDEFLANEATKEIPIVAVTGHSLSSREREGFAKVFLKPVSMDTVTSCLRQLVEGHS